jgi:hypothetical protein
MPKCESRRSDIFSTGRSERFEKARPPELLRLLDETLIRIQLFRFRLEVEIDPAAGTTERFGRSTRSDVNP